ncbi:DUF1629 domain-containing protein [uncultured Shewanella sp.]|uniref:imm11 family protein n=1 Tax=uncultured Shewanella sp. TaxID=173975 RepID=UPI002625E35E|nr:DUF1629 domain-containing protein [uncultured Shewanella sp.]
MYWIMFSERKDEKETKLMGVPKIVTELDFECDLGKHITGDYPVIEYDFEEDDDLDFPNDNLMAPGFKGLLMHKRVSKILREIEVNNIQEFPVLLKGIDGHKNSDDYELVNIIGDADIVDYEKSDITLRRPKKIKFIDSLSFIDTSDMPLPYIFRLTSFLPLIIAHDKVKQAFEAKNITGFTFYKPEDFYL